MDGIFVCNGTAGDYFERQVRRPRRRRRWCSRFAAARWCAPQCEREELQKEFWDYCHTDVNSDRVGELAFGTNLGLRDMIGILLQDEKVPGVHLAFGDPYGSQTDADWTAKTHVDVLTRDCDVWIDDEQVIAEGRYLLDRFDLGDPAARSTVSTRSAS